MSNAIPNLNGIDIQSKQINVSRDLLIYAYNKTSLAFVSEFMNE